MRHGRLTAVAAPVPVPQAPQVRELLQTLTGCGGGRLSVVSVA